MKIAGLQKVSLIDYPDAVAAGVFLGGCNLDCGYCHNRWMIGARYIEPVISVDELLAWLETRVGLLDGVVISGGEPTLHSELDDLIERIKSLGFACKLDSNGTRPTVLRRLLEAGLVDYVAMDLKAPLETEAYRAMAGVAVDIAAIRESMTLLRDLAPSYEFRTTVAPGLGLEDLLSIAGEMLPEEPWVLQPFVAAETVRQDVAERPAMSEGDLEAILDDLRAVALGVRLRA